MKRRMWRHPAEILSRAAILSHRIQRRFLAIKSGIVGVLFRRVVARRSSAFKAVIMIAIVRIADDAAELFRVSGSAGGNISDGCRIVCIVAMLRLMVVIVLLLLMIGFERRFELPPRRMLEFVRRFPIVRQHMIGLRIVVIPPRIVSASIDGSGVGREILNDFRMDEIQRNYRIIVVVVIDNAPSFDVVLVMDGAATAAAALVY